MKQLSELATSFLPKSENKIVHAIQGPFVVEYLQVPIMSSEVRCPMCGGNEGYVIFNGETSLDHLWTCAGDVCAPRIAQTNTRVCQPTAKHKRELEWPLFCEMNGIGDEHHSVRFESIQQTAEKVEYLLKFATKPRSIIFMQGDAGSGKTYASMGVCEFFTRNSRSAIFSTQEKMRIHWLQEDKLRYAATLENCSLLVVDDFGTGEPSSTFMMFLLNLINTRMQWSDRGTIISTNLNDKDFVEYCGKALSDRVRTGKKFIFNEKSRRKQIIL